MLNKTYKFYGGIFYWFNCNSDCKCIMSLQYEGLRFKYYHDSFRYR